MRKFGFVSILFLICLISSTSRDYAQGGRPVPPGVREADKQINAPIEPPANLKQKPTDPAKLRQEADELAKLSAAIPSQIDQVGHGQLPKDLADQLKRIEKLAKHLRSEVSP
ncbi:MAG TPA: hypothetical protein VJA94_15205 [Candidatus Angelobacter sp.]